MMHGYNSDGEKATGPYHGDPHPYDEVCETTPPCRPVEDDAAGYRPPPKHYQGDGTIDPWRIWDAYDLDRYTANAVKYLLRAGKKDIAPRLDDLKKAADYIAKAIEMEEQK